MVRSQCAFLRAQLRGVPTPPAVPSPQTPCTATGAAPQTALGWNQQGLGWVGTERRALLAWLVGAAVSDAAASPTLQPSTHLPCCQEKSTSLPSYFGTTCGTEGTPQAEWEKGPFHPEQRSSDTHGVVTQTTPGSTREGEPLVLDKQVCVTSGQVGNGSLEYA